MSDVSQLTIASGSYPIKDKTARTNIDELGTDLAQTNENVQENTNNITEISKYMFNLNDSYRFLVVSKVDGSKFTTINSAITYARNTLHVDNNNPVVILITTGVYQEQIVLNDVHGLTFIGLDKNQCKIQFNGSYPDCVIHVQGDITFKNLTLIGLNSTIYIVHQDPSDTNVQGTICFENCIFNGGSNGIGYGSGQNTELKVMDCEFINQSGWCIYAHNSPYARTNQTLTLIRNRFSKAQCLDLDDAGNSYGLVNTSPIFLNLFGNSCMIQAFGSVRFQENTNTETYKTYIESQNYKMSANCQCNTNIPSMNVNYLPYSGKTSYNIYMTVPQEDSGGGSRWYVDLGVPTTIYNITINSVTLPGQGDITTSFAISSKTAFGVIFYCNNTAYVGKQVIVNFDVIMGG